MSERPFTDCVTSFAKLIVMDLMGRVLDTVACCLTFPIRNSA